MKNTISCEECDKRFLLNKILFQKVEKKQLKK